MNTHGGNLSEAYIIGMTHVREAVEQIRGTAVNQVEGAEIALVTGGPAALPVSGTLLGEERGMSERTGSAAGRVPVDPDAAAAPTTVAAVLGCGGGGPARRAAVHQLRHVPAAAAAVLLRVPAPRGRVGRAAGHGHRVQLHRGASPAGPDAPRVVPYASGIVELDGTQGAGAG